MDVRSDLNFSLCLDRSWSSPLPSQDPEAVFEVHLSHTIAPSETACTVCGMRANWPGISVRCLAKPGHGSVLVGDVPALIMSELADLLDTWERAGHAEALPSLDEWIAELIEHRRAKKKAKR